MTLSEPSTKPAGDPAASEGKAAILDLSLLRGVCTLPEQQQERLVHALSTRYQLVVTEVLIEEAFVAYADGLCDKKIARRIMFRPRFI